MDQNNTSHTSNTVNFHNKCVTVGFRPCGHGAGNL